MKVKAAIAQAQRPVMIIAHSLGVPTALQATVQNAEKFVALSLLRLPMSLMRKYVPNI